MSVTFRETKDSRAFDLNAKDGSATWKFLAHAVSEANPENAVYTTILADTTNVPYVWNGLVRGKPSAVPLGNGYYDVTLPYKQPEGGSTSDPGAVTPAGGQPPSPPPNQPQANDLVGNEFSIQAGFKPPRLFFSRKTLIRTAPAGLVAPDYHRAINVSGSGGDLKAEGVELPEPPVVFTVSKTFDYMTWGYIDKLLDVCWKTNNAPFYGRPTGQVVLLDAHGQVQKDGRVPMQFRFGVDKGEDTVAISDGFTIDAPGRPPWHYVWVAYGGHKAAADTFLGLSPIGAYVEQLLDEADYSVLGLG